MTATTFDPDPGGFMKRKTRALGVQRAVLPGVIVSVALAGCATSSKDIASAYVSPLQYQGYDCAQLTAEALRVQQRVDQLGGRLDQAASNDKALVGVGMILFWPALFALGGTKEQEAEFARLKGEYDAVQATAVQKKCDPIVPPLPAGPASAPQPAASQAMTASVDQPIVKERP
jgi:hypothetical protein